MPAKLVFAGKPFRQHRQHQRIDAGALLTPLLKKIVERDGPCRQHRCRRQEQAGQKLLHDSPARSVCGTDSRKSGRPAVPVRFKAVPCRRRRTKLSSLNPSADTYSGAGFSSRSSRRRKPRSTPVISIPAGRFPGASQPHNPPPPAADRPGTEIPCRRISYFSTLNFK